MKQIRSHLSALAIVWVALFTVATATAQTLQDGVLKVVKIQGAARYMPPGTTAWQPLKVGTVLKPGIIIQTAANSYVDVILNNRNAVAGSGSGSPDVMVYQPKAEQDAIRIFENTVLGVDKLTLLNTGTETVTETQLDLKHGRIFGTVKKLAPASKYEIKIPNGVAGIRGTIYFLDSNGVLTVISGSVMLAWVAPDGSVVTQMVGPGQQYDARTGQLTQASESVIQEMSRLATVFYVRPNMGNTRFTVDQTIYFVSPTQDGQVETDSQ